ncbi:hypothetical protein [Sorangium sp. So ce385]|uniref:hypothetical protein n=1 Tax=Sorangium sp. So ce385 TaxID=3133308 RepID=UPI003F5C526D
MAAGGCGYGAAGGCGYGAAGGCERGVTGAKEGGCCAGGAGGGSALPGACCAGRCAMGGGGCGGCGALPCGNPAGTGENGAIGRPAAAGPSVAPGRSLDDGRDGTSRRSASAASSGCESGSNRSISIEGIEARSSAVSEMRRRQVCSSDGGASSSSSTGGDGASSSLAIVSRRSGSLGCPTSEAITSSSAVAHSPSSEARNGCPAAPAASAARRSHTMASRRSPRAHSALAVEIPHTTSSSSFGCGSGRATTRFAMSNTTYHRPHCGRLPMIPSEPTSRFERRASPAARKAAPPRA